MVGHSEKGRFYTRGKRYPLISVGSEPRLLRTEGRVSSLVPSGDSGGGWSTSPALRQFPVGARHSARNWIGKTIGDQARPTRHLRESRESSFPGQAGGLGVAKGGMLTQRSSRGKAFSTRSLTGGDCSSI